MNRHYVRTSKVNEYPSSSTSTRSDPDTPRLYLIVHNIDGLSGSDAHRALSTLASCDSVCVVATMVHLNASLMWDDETLQRFRWVYRHMPTFENHPFPVDFALLASSGKQSSKEVAIEAVESVLESLTFKHKDVFIKLCKAVSAAGNADGASGSSKRSVAGDPIRGVQFGQICKNLRSDFSVKSEDDFNRALKEFLDHGIIHKVNTANKEYIRLNMSDADIQSIATRNPTDVKLIMS